MTWSLPSAAGQRPAAASTLRTHSTGPRAQRSTVPPTVSGAKNRVTPPDQRLHGRPGRDNHRMAAVLQYADPTPTPGHAERGQVHRVAHDPGARPGALPPARQEPGRGYQLPRRDKRHHRPGPRGVVHAADPAHRVRRRQLCHAQTETHPTEPSAPPLHLVLPRPHCLSAGQLSHGQPPYRSPPVERPGALRAGRV